MRSISFIAVAIAALIVGAAGAWVLWAGLQAQSWHSIAYGAVTVVAGIAMLARQSWSRFLVYAVVATFIVAWTYIVVGAVRAGAWVQYDTLQRFLSLVPGLAMVGVSLACAFIAARFLPRRGGQA
jgi:hypothetical protein